MTVRRLRLDEARRIAVRAQLLSADRPPDLATVLHRLTLLQLDPTDVVAPNADLVAWSRLGGGYRPEQLRQALEHDRTAFEHRYRQSDRDPLVAAALPTADLGLYLADMAVWPADARRREWLAANAGFRSRLLAELDASGPLASRDVLDTADVPWPSSGWTNNRNVTQMLEFLLARGEIAVAARRGRQRLWDVAGRVYPAGVTTLPSDVADAARAERRLRALGITRPYLVGDAGEPVEVEGLAGEWRVDPAASAEGFTGRAALLSPFDRLIHDRVRARELFDFEYHLEMYKPAAKRRWGYYALPVLYGERLVGKVDLAADRKAGALRVEAVHEDVPWTRPIKAGVDAELGALAAWLEVERCWHCQHGGAEHP